MPKQTEEATKQERGTVYGDHHFGMTNVGKMWSGILSQHLQQPLPNIEPDIVDLMMAALKIARVSQPLGKGHEDSYHDARVYLGMGKESADLINKANK